LLVDKVDGRVQIQIQIRIQEAQKHTNSYLEHCPKGMAIYCPVYYIFWTGNTFSFPEVPKLTR
jgi:hypothetical protein